MIKRTDRFTGEVGEYCTTYNALVRIVGKEEAKIIQNSKEDYKSLNFAIYKAATENKIVYGKDVRHPKWKVPAFFADLQSCPINTMFNFPKELIIDCNSKIKTITNSELNSYIENLLDYTKKNLTTEALLNYIINE